MTDTQRNRLQRWEDKRRDQMSVTNNLLLTIGVAVCGYLFDKVVNHEIILDCLMYAGCVLIFLSVVFGSCLTVSRLLDYRHTVKKIRAEIASDTATMNSHSTKAEKFGNASWILFWFQISAMAVSVILFLIYLLQY